VTRGAIGVLVYNLDEPGGMERQAALLARVFAALGREVVIVTSFQEKRRRLRERKDGVAIYRVPFPRVGDYRTWQELLETVAAWVFRLHRVDVVYAVQAHTCGVHAARVARVLDRPVVLKLACSGEAGDLCAVEREPAAAEIRDRLRALDRVVYLNAESRAEAIAAGIDPGRLVSIPNGVDASRFPADLAPAELTELGPAEGRELVLFAGRLDAQKRVDVLVEAFARLVARRAGARLAIAGKGPEREGLERLARERAVADRVAFLGVRDDVPRLLRAARVLVLPSASEGISNVILEAMAVGTPVIATDVAGNRELVRHEREGLLVPVGDAAALERALERLLGDHALATKLAGAGRARIDEEFAIERVARRYLELFDSLPERRPVSSARFLARIAVSDLRSPGWLALRGSARLARSAVRFVLRSTSRATTRADRGAPAARS
jgi:glycosyltransferase involved in cell wall biosynthesis